MFSLKGKTALVTGASKWLGFDMASALAAAGANIIISSRSAGRAAVAAAEISERYGVDASGIELDQRSWAGVKAAAGKAAAFSGRIDILINNAGGGSGRSEGDLFKRSPEDIAEMINVNLTGVIYCCKAVSEIMAGAGGGRIINIASVAALVGRDRELYRRTGKTEQPVDYAAAKGGVLALTRDLAAFLAPHGINVNSISPGGFDKGDLPGSFVDGYADLNLQKRMGRFGEPSGGDIGGAAVFLSSDASAHITGQNIVVDGGFAICR